MDRIKRHSHHRPLRPLNLLDTYGTDARIRRTAPKNHLHTDRCNDAGCDPLA